MRTMAATVIDRLVIVAYGAGPPTEPEWLDYVRLIARQGVERTMQLVFTEGGEPTAVQRRQLDALFAGRAVPVAIVSDSARVRGTAMLLSWVNRQVKAFRPSQLGDALAYLEIPTTRGDLIERELRKLVSEVEGLHVPARRSGGAS